MLYFIGDRFSSFVFVKSIYLRAIISFVMGLFIVMVLGKPFIDFLKSENIGEKIREDGPKEQLSKAGTPTMGGVLIVFAILAANLTCAHFTNPYIMVLYLTTLMFAALGFIDDFKKFTVSKEGLSGKKKLLGQAILALIVWAVVVKFGITGNTRLDLSIINPMHSRMTWYIGVFGMLVLILLVILGTSNAVNLTDGMDGLTTMPMIICCSIFATIAYFTGHRELSSHLNLYYSAGAGEISIYLAAVIGACLGFLWYNCYPAQIFMGDTGSLTLGGILGVVAILLKQELLLPVVGGLYVLEALSVIIQTRYYKLTGGKRIFLCAPFHHHFEKKGIHESKIIIRFWIVSVIFAMIGMGIVRMRGLL